MFSRRAFVATSAAMLAGRPWRALLHPGQPNGTRLILLGTGGGPQPRPSVAASYQVIIVDGRTYVIDCGDGVARQLASAGVPLTTLRHIFITCPRSRGHVSAGNQRIIARAQGAPRLRQHLTESHTSAEEAGRVAQAAGVKHLVLSHLVPPDDPTVTDQMWIGAARVHYQGAITAGKEPMEI